MVRAYQHKTAGSSPALRVGSEEGFLLQSFFGDFPAIRVSQQPQAIALKTLPAEALSGPAGTPPEMQLGLLGAVLVAYPSRSTLGVPWPVLATAPKHPPPGIVGFGYCTVNV